MSRILHIINSLGIGGAERLLTELVPAVNSYCEVDVLLLKKDSSHFKKLLISRGIKVIELSNLSIYNPLQIFKIYKYIFRYDVIHVHLFPAQYWVAFAKRLCFWSKCKLVTTEHSTDNRRRRYILFKILDKIVYNTYDTIISISAATQSELLTWIQVQDTSRFLVINNGVKLEEIWAAESVDLPIVRHDNVKTLLMVSRFDLQKDQSTLVKALTYLPENYYLILVGAGPNEAKIKALVNNLKIDGRVFFMGIRADVYNIIKASRICILSSHSEGFGLAAVEYMAASKPTIVSNVSGLADVVGTAGLLFEQGNSRQLADLILSLGENETFYEEVASRCYHRSLDFSIDKMVDAYLKVYKELNQVNL